MAGGQEPRDPDVASGSLGSWIWFAIAFAGAERRHPAVLRLAGALEGRAGGNGDSGCLDRQMRWRIRPWLERARADVGEAEAGRLVEEGARMTLRELWREALAEPDGRCRECPFSSREREIVQMVLDGLTDGEIAERLHISKRTVESHVEHVKRKIGVSRRTQIVAWAYRNGCCVN
jgi:DNA-binding CsgD family transcriptional regulator